VEKKVELNGREQDLELRMAAQARGLNPQDNHDELTEFIELQRLLQDVEADRIIEASCLAALVRDVSQVLENLGMPPSQESPEIHVPPVTSWGRWT
jgi:hypothetical protein